MSSKKTPVPTISPKSKTKGTIDSILDFGPGPVAAPTSGDMTERLRQIVRQLQEINRRIDNLSSRF